MSKTNKEIVWYRRSALNSAFLFGSFIFPLTILFVVIILLTGDVYYDDILKNGERRKWGKGNRIAAFIILGLYIFGYIYLLSSV